jgi:hypothetical protein
MDPKKFDVLVHDALASNERKLKDVTKLQYLSQLRNFHNRLGKRPLGTARVVDLRGYVDGLTSAWTRRRAVSALRLLFRHLGRPAIADALLENGYTRPKRISYKALARQLRSAGWSELALRNLTWSNVHGAVLGRMQPAVTENSYEFDRSALVELRLLLCMRYPSAVVLLSARSKVSRVFRQADLVLNARTTAQG